MLLYFKLLKYVCISNQTQQKVTKETPRFLVIVRSVERSIVHFQHKPSIFKVWVLLLIQVYGTFLFLFNLFLYNC